MRYANGQTFLILNAAIGKMIETGNLLPLSLKKQTNQVIIKKVNFDRPAEIEEIEKLSFYGLSDWKPRTKTNNKQARNLELYITPNKREYIQMLHVTESSGGWKANFMLKGSEARHGSLGSQHIFAEIIAIIDPTFASKWLRAFTSSNDNFKKKLKALGPKPEKVTKSKVKGAVKVEDSWRNSREEFSSEVTNDVMPLLIAWFKNKKKSERFVQLSYQYVTSRSNDSSPFVIAK